MAKNNVSEYDVVAANNTDISGNNITGTGLVSTADDSFRANSANLAKWWDDLGGVNTVAGTGDAITITTPTVYTALKTGMRFNFKASAINTTAVTLNFDAIGAKAVRKISGGTDIALAAGDIPGANFRIDVIYDAAANAAAGAWILLGSAAVAAATTSAAGIVELLTNTEAITGSDTTRAATAANLLATRQLLNGVPFNLGLAAAVGSSALTISLKGADGNDPSATNPVEIPFRNVTAGTGTPTVLQVTGATSVVVSSGSTLGTTNGIATTLIVVAFNDGGTFRLGVINPLNMPLKDGIASSTAEGGAGAADSAGVIYTGSAVTSKAMAVLGWLTISEATAGTWATAHSAIGTGNAPNTAMQFQAGQLLAWIDFDGTGTPAIRGSGNVSSITDNGTGDYTINFTTALPDANYCPVFGASTTSSAFFTLISGAAPTRSALRIGTISFAGAAVDATYVSAAVFR